MRRALTAAVPYVAWVLLVSSSTISVTLLASPQWGGWVPPLIAVGAYAFMCLRAIVRERRTL